MLDKQALIDFEADLARRWELGEIKAPLHLSGGNEDELIEIFKEIKLNDIVYSSHRNHYHALLHGVDAHSLLDEILGKPTGRCLGRARSMGFIDRSRNFYSSAIVGGMCAVAVGAAWALKESKSECHVWCFGGDGMVDGGHFWEALTYAHGWDLPITFVIEDNDQATCTSKLSRKGPVTEFYVLASKMIKYNYKPAYPHVGTGKYVQF